MIYYVSIKENIYIFGCRIYLLPEINTYQFSYSFKLFLTNRLFTIRYQREKSNKLKRKDRNKWTIMPSRW